MNTKRARKTPARTRIVLAARRPAAPLQAILLMAAILPAALLLTGCGDDFPDEELHFGLEQKTRPFAVVLDPPDAYPGQTVNVTLMGHCPEPAALDISWQVALDYDLGLYEVDEIERNLRPVPSTEPVFDEDGFFTQSFSWTVPDSTLQWSSALPEVMGDDLLGQLARLAMTALGVPPTGPLTKAAVEHALTSLLPSQVQALDPESRELVLGLVDRFACQVRLRATLDDGNLVDVTRNLTVRHSGRLPSNNLNLNTQVFQLDLVALHLRDAETADLEDESLTRTTFNLTTEAEQPFAPTAIPYHRDWSYFLLLDYELQGYDAPYEPGLRESESGIRHWYYYRRDDPASPHPLFLNDDGDPAEMFDLDDEARIDPPGVGADYRIVAVPRDRRTDWVAFHATPGTDVAQAWITFVEPVE